MGCSPSMLSDSNQNHKDGSLFCVNIRRSSVDNLQNGENDMTDPQNAICQQALINPYQKDVDDEYDKQYVKKDSIVSVTGLGPLSTLQTVVQSVRRAAGGIHELYNNNGLSIPKKYAIGTYELRILRQGTTASASGRLGHRKSSLALTPEEEPLDTNTKSTLDYKYPNLLPPNPAIKVLLVFPRQDNVAEAYIQSSNRLQYDVSLKTSMSAAIEAFQNSSFGGHHMIIVDGRYTKMIDPEVFARTIKGTKGSQFTVMVAVVRKQVFEKEDTVILSLLDAGYNRCIMESVQLSICSSELRQIQHSLVRPQNVISTQQALYTALHRTRDAVIITDDLARVQYANRATERLFNMRLDEIVGRPLSDLVQSDLSAVLSQIHRSREFDSAITIKRKNMDNCNVHVRCTPMACIGRTPTHLVITLDHSPPGTDVLPALPIQKEAPRGSLHSIRRGSFDVRSIASDGLRRTSLAKLSSLPLEAPITKVVTLLTQVQENCSPEEAKLLDRVMEFLKREGLYSPQMKELKPEDPVATDLIGALLTQGQTGMLSSRRSSNDSVARSATRSQSLMPPKSKLPGELNELLNHALEWDFNIFKLEDLTEKRPLLYLGMELFKRFEVTNTLSVDETTLKNWLIIIESHYRPSNSYHTSTHAADVMQATASYLNLLHMKDNRVMDNIDEATSLIAAAAHDIDHPGRSSAFLCNSDDSLAVLYNDLCVLESHHAALTFKLTLSDDKINIFKNLDRDTYKHFRLIIIDMILATEMTRHFEHLAKFVSIFGADVDTKDALAFENEDNQILIRRMLIKCADVSNPTRPLFYCVEWARRIAEEYFTQTDEEKGRNLPIVMPMFDRNTCSISKSQIGFIDYIIQDMMHAWDGFIDMPELIQYLQHNYTQWKQFDDQGIHTLSDIKHVQKSLQLSQATTGILK